MLQLSNGLLEPLLLFGLMGLLWSFEGIAPLFTPRPGTRIRHALPNAMLYLFKAGLNVGLAAVLIGAINESASRQFGLLYLVRLPDWLHGALAFVLLDLFGYLLHRVSHAVPLLWRLHRVHHTDLIVDVTTYLRTHPGEALVGWIWQLSVVILIGVPLGAYTIYVVVTLAVALFQHSNIKLPRGVDRTLGLIMITPNLHKVHHSCEVRETDSNFGPFLAIWDQLFKTLIRPRSVAQLRYGLTEFRHGKWHSLRGLLATPWAKGD